MRFPGVDTHAWKSFVSQRLGGCRNCSLRGRSSEAQERNFAGIRMKCFLALWVICAAAIHSFSLDREAFAFTRYDLDVRVEPEQQRLAVRGSITLRNDSSSAQKNAVLQISSSLSWRSIQCEGKLLQFVSQPYTSDVDHTGELSEAIVRLPHEVPTGGSVELSIGYEGVILLDATRFTRIGMPKEAAVHSDWDQIGPAFSAVRGVGYVAWYPIATEAGNLSEGRSLIDAIGRWKKHAQNAEMTIQLRVETNPGGARPKMLCGENAPWVSEQTTGPQEFSIDCHYSQLGLRAPSFVIANYDVLDRPVVQIAYRAEHKSNAEKFAQAADTVAPFVTEWFGSVRSKAQVAELFDSGASPFESGTVLLTPLSDTDPKLLQIALVHELTHAAFPSARPWIYEGSRTLHRLRIASIKRAARPHWTSWDCIAQPWLMQKKLFMPAKKTRQRRTNP